MSSSATREMPMKVTITYQSSTILMATVKIVATPVLAKKWRNGITEARLME